MTVRGLEAEPTPVSFTPAAGRDLYPDARHELLNETNRDEVTARILAFLTSAL